MSNDHSFLDACRRHDRFRRRGISEGLHPLPVAEYVVGFLLSLACPSVPVIQAVATAQVKITYNGNGNTGGSPPADSSWYDVGSDIVVADDGTLVREDVGSPPVDYTFSCWNTQADGLGTDYDPDDFYVGITAMTTLYAKWVVA
jgi:hypothetical protein